MPPIPAPLSRARFSPNLALDVWAVVLAFLLALAVRFGLLTKVPW